MRTILSFLVLCTLILPLSGQDTLQSLETPFEHLKVSGNIRLVLIPSHTQELEFKPGQDREAIKFEIREKELILKAKTELKKSPAIQLKLKYKSLLGLEVNTGAHVSSADTLAAKVFTLKAETGGKAELRILADSISARVNQGADIILYGRTRIQSVNAYTWGNYLSNDLDVETTWVKAATGAQVKVNAGDMLHINSTSKATVGYWGEPGEKQISTSVGGEVTQLTE
ncbi:MAG: DUF2807 domain-containing protein [Bacteroidota bacterium]